MPHFRINGSPIDTLRKGYKQARNEVNNFIKSAKKEYFIKIWKWNQTNPRKTWMLTILVHANVAQHEIFPELGLQRLFCDRLDQIWLVKLMQPSPTEPEFYLQPKDTIFSLKVPSASNVYRLLNQLDAKKATGLDKILCKIWNLSKRVENCQSYTAV